ncbi:DNA repair protein XRCC1-like [Convolutriloba macropyga]|uniref:DNA repair protein XRCC1-like n=1 Tax=Convolutriloba macropyga TaxID=536237 RepID=UPI003F51B65E
MPRVAHDSVVSVSSEHPEHPASNVFAESDAYWTCAKQDDKQASIIIQLQSSTKINSIHIGNHGSAFVEVLVSNKAAAASSKQEEDFKVLLLCSSLMTLQESRGEKNMKGVKMFTSDKLNSEVRDQYWDRVKVVCTQPFNKHLYGLTFLKLSGETRDVKTETQPATTVAPSTSTVTNNKNNNPLSSLNVPSVTSDLAPDTIKIGSFFKNRQSLTNSINAASAKGDSTNKLGSIASEMRTTTPSELVPKKPESESPTVTASNDNSSPARSKPPRKIPKLEATTTSTPPATATPKPTVSRQSSKETVNKTPQQTAKPTPVKQASVKTEETTPKTPAVKYDSFENLMNGVVICLSGFINPLRGELRQKAMEMGAKYKQDWAGECTHLICAFANTPKFNQVRKSSPSAFVVKKEWILDSHQQRTKLNLTKYSMVSLTQQAKNEPEIKADSDSNNRAERKEATAENPKVTATSSATPTLRQRDQPNHKRKSDSPSLDDNDESAYDVETDEEYNPYEEQAHYDSDDEPEQLISIKKASSSTTTTTTTTENKTTSKQEDTDKESNLDEMELPPLPDFFRRRKFMLFGSFDSEMRRIMKRLIVAYNGILLEYMGEDVNYIVTNERWSDKFDQVLEDNSSVQFVRPSWLTACDKQQKTVPLQYHLVPPS